MGILVRNNIQYSGNNGLSVEPNTQETPTDTLDTLKINNTVYEVGSGGGSGLPGNYTPTPLSLQIESPSDCNELGWGIIDDIYYFDTAASWIVGGRTFTKDNATPALGAVFKPSNSQWYHSYLLSTNADATGFYCTGYGPNRQKYSFEYNGHTWYYSGGEYSLTNASVSGIEVVSEYSDSEFSSFLKHLIDQSEVYFDDYANTITHVGTPASGVLFAGGGEEADLSDATFKVESDGTIHSKELQVTDDVKVDGNTIVSRELTYAQYQALTPAQQTDGTTYYVTDLNMNGTGDQFQPVIYSEAEREIGVWCDGKPLYKRVYEITAPISLTANTWVQTTFAQGDIERLTEVKVSDSAGACADNIAGGFVSGYIALNSPRTVQYNAVSYLIIQYTKTTDQPGSGTWTPQGVPAHHYSTDEQIVGTWIDGSTIYERTVEIINSFSSSYPYDVSSFSNGILNFEGYYLCTTNKGTYRIPLNYYEDNTYHTYTGYNVTTNKMFLKVYGFTGQKAILTIRYTKIQSSQSS